MFPIRTPPAGYRRRRPLMTATLVAAIAIVMTTAMHSSAGAQSVDNADGAGSRQFASPAMAVVASSIRTAVAPHTSAGPAPAGKAAVTRPNRPTKDSASQSVAARKLAAQRSPSNWMTDLIPKVDPNGRAEWVFERNGGWGASDGHTIYVDPDMPAENRYAVMVHEYGHVMQARVYGSLGASAAAMSAVVGDDPSSITANESTADCMAQILGATWVGYGCNDALRGAATAVLAGERP